MVEIAKALSLHAKVIVMDEPTSALNAPEVAKLFGLIERLKEQGCGIVYITHKMEEVDTDCRPDHGARETVALSARHWLVTCRSQS